MAVDRVSSNRGRSSRTYLLLYLASLLVSTGFSHKILFLPGPMGGSHFIVSASIADELVRRGHEVTTLINDIFEYRAKTENSFRYEFYNSSYTLEEFRYILDEYALTALSGHAMYAVITHGTEELKAAADECNAVISDVELVDRLRAEKFDVIVGDALFLCPALISEYLEVPYIALLANTIFPIQARQFSNLPSHAAYVPEFLTGFDDNLGLLKRTYNFISYVVTSFVLDSDYVLWKYNEMKRVFNIKPEVTMRHSIKRAEIGVYNADFALEFARPLMPNGVNTGGLTAKPAALPLDQELEDFMASGGEAGVVYLTFGTYVNSMTEEQTNTFAMAMARLPQKVIWQFKGQAPSHLGNNTRLMRWVPQNDLLGHPALRAFVSHGGTNGIYEAIYHGVPMVGIPFFGDHFDNVARMTAKGLGLSLHISDLDPDHLFDIVNTVINDKRFKDRAMHLSKLHRDYPLSATQKAAFWVEHILKYGGGDLQPATYRLNLLQYFQLDLAALLLLLVAGTAATVSALLRGPRPAQGDGDRGHRHSNGAGANGHLSTTTTTANGHSAPSLANGHSKRRQKTNGYLKVGVVEQSVLAVH